MTQVAPVLTLPIPFFVIFDFARDRPSLYHVYVCISTWAWSIYQIIFMCVTLVRSSVLSSPLFSSQSFSTFVVSVMTLVSKMRIQIGMR